MIGGILATLAGSAWARAAARYGVIGLAIFLFLLSLRRSVERVGRLAEVHDSQQTWTTDCFPCLLQGSRGVRGTHNSPVAHP